MIRAPWRHGGDRQTPRSNPSNLLIWHLFLLSFTPHNNFNDADYIYTFLSHVLVHIHITVFENNTDIPNCGSEELQTKGYGDHFPMRRGSAWHKGTDKWVPSTTMAAGWPSKSWEQRGWMRADDIPYPNHLTWLVMPTTRSAPLGLSEAEMCVGYSKECTNLLFIKCGVTWEWRLNGDLSMIQLLHRRSHMKLWLFLIRHMGLAKCVKDCD